MRPGWAKPPFAESTGLLYRPVVPVRTVTTLCSRAQGQTTSHAPIFRQCSAGEIQETLQILGEPTNLLTGFCVPTKWGQIGSDSLSLFRRMLGRC
jgi:hypothetical protein